METCRSAAITFSTPTTSSSAVPSTNIPRNSVARTRFALPPLITACWLLMCTFRVGPHRDRPPERNPSPPPQIRRWRVSHGGLLPLDHRVGQHADAGDAALGHRAGADVHRAR